MSRLQGLAISQGLVMTAIIAWHGAPLITEAAPYGIVSLELAEQVYHAIPILDSWEDAGVTDVARHNLWLDFLYMFSYPFALYHLLRASGYRGARVVLLATLPLLDGVENVLLLRALGGALDDGELWFAALCAMIKFGIVIGALLAAPLRFISDQYSRARYRDV